MATMISETHPDFLVTSHALTICSLLDHLLDAKLICLLYVVCPSRGPFLLRWTALITLRRWEVSGELAGRTQRCWLPSGLAVHLACSGHSQACVSDRNETIPILSILVLNSKVFGELFIKDWQVGANQRRPSPLITTAGLCPIPETVPTTCHFLAVPHFGTQTVCNWKSPTSVTFKSGMKNDQLATSSSMRQLNFQALFEPRCGGLGRKGLWRRSTHRSRGIAILFTS